MGGFLGHAAAGLLSRSYSQAKAAANGAVGMGPAAMMRVFDSSPSDDGVDDDGEGFGGHAPPTWKEAFPAQTPTEVSGAWGEGDFSPIGYSWCAALGTTDDQDCRGGSFWRPFLCPQCGCRFCEACADRFAAKTSPDGTTAGCYWCLSA